MGKSNAVLLGEFGQSIWLDYISRSLIEEGKLKEMIAEGLRGMTSNPTIFDKAISLSASYDEAIMRLHKKGKSTFQIYDALTIKDIQDASDLFRPVYERTDGLDGYVSLEINPTLAYRVKETVEEGRRLWKAVDRPNVMFKVPATTEGFQATEELIAAGFNINVTLLFSLEQYRKTAQAYMKGMERLIENGSDPQKVRSVASVFVSRIDTLVDKTIEEMLGPERDEAKIEKLHFAKGKAAVANSKLIYKQFLDITAGEQFRQLAQKGTRTQRVLWGSTSTKNPHYSDIKYVAELIAKDTVNTMPEETYRAFLDHGQVKEALAADIAEAERVIKALKEVGIDIDRVCSQLLSDGVAAFEKSFKSLLGSIEQKAKKLSGGILA